MVRYVTLAYGDAPGVYRQSLMLLVSLVAYAPGPYELVVATDRPEVYVWFGTRVEIEYIDGPRLDSWRGRDPFSMRQKIALLQSVWPRDGHVVLLDADLLATADLASFVDRLGRGDLFMHKREYEFGRTRRAGNRRLWQSLKDRTFGAWQIRRDEAMWNSGVVGLAAADRTLIDQTLELYDVMGSAGVRHFATEQLVESLVLGRTGRLHPADGWFTHYWGNRPIELPLGVLRTHTEKLRRGIGRRPRESAG
jgi:hypothetical protein